MSNMIAATKPEDPMLSLKIIKAASHHSNASSVPFVHNYDVTIKESELALHLCDAIFIYP